MPTIKEALRFVAEASTAESSDVLSLVDPLGTFRGLVGQGSFRTPSEKTQEQLFGFSTVGASMGLVSSLLQFGAKLIGGGAQVAAKAAPVVSRAVAGTGRALAGRAPQIGRLALGVGGALAGGAAFEAGLGLFDGDGAAALPEGSTVTQLSGGGFIARGPQGGMRILNRNGKPIKPSRIIPFGERLPGGARVVAINAAGTQIGITIRRPRRSFSGEINRLRKTIRAVDAVHKALRPSKRRRL